MADLVVCLAMANTKPYVQVASVCERVLQDADGVISAIRLVDKVTLESIPLAVAPNVPSAAKPITAIQVLDLWILVLLKSGDLVGEFRVALQMRDPKEKVVALPLDSPVVFKGNDGVNVKFRFGLPHNAPGGRYWFDVLWDGEVLTSIPFIVKQEAVQEGEGSPTDS